MQPGFESPSPTNRYLGTARAAENQFKLFIPWGGSAPPDPLN